MVQVGRLDIHVEIAPLELLEIKRYVALALDWNERVRVPAGMLLAFFLPDPPATPPTWHARMQDFWGPKYAWRVTKDYIIFRKARP